MIGNCTTLRASQKAINTKEKQGFLKKGKNVMKRFGD